MRSAESKIAPLEEVAARAAAERAAGRKVAVAGGAFELLHAGSIRFLDETKAGTDVLIAAVVEEDGSRAVVSVADRAILVGALRSVDHVLVVRSRADLEALRQALAADVFRLEADGETRALLDALRR